MARAAARGEGDPQVPVARGALDPRPKLRGGCGVLRWTYSAGAVAALVARSGAATRHTALFADVVELLHRHADAGHVAAACRLGIAFARGQFGLARNSRRAAAASAKSNLAARRLAETVFMVPV